MKRSLVIIFLFLLLSIDPIAGQEESTLPEAWRDPADDRAVEHGFIFVRAKYTNYPGSGGPGYGYGGARRQWWETDFDGADRNLLKGLQRYTTMDASSRGYKAS